MASDPEEARTATCRNRCEVAGAPFLLHDVAVLPVPAIDRVVALAPDPGSMKAGRELASPRRWTGLGRDDGALWGLAQGSGKDPYQVQVALAELATKCSCPSRKFPCKHALGLLFLAAERPDLVPAGAPPAFVAEWREQRADRAQKQQQRAAAAETATAAAPVDVAAQAQRRARRAARMEDGVELLQQWLADVVRGGLAAEELRRESHARSMEQRLVDAQAPGLAWRVARLGELLRRGAAAADSAMDEIGRLHTLLAAARAQERLSDAQRQAVQQALGASVPTASVLAGPTTPDGWFVAARSLVERERLVTTSTWLFGRSTGRWACLQQTSPVHLRTGDTFVVGTTLHGELCWYPGPAPLRAAFREAPAVRHEPPPAAEPFARLLQRHAEALVDEPWRTQTPGLVAAQPGTLDGAPALVDGDGAALPARLRTADALQLAAVTGGRPALVSVAFDGAALVPWAVHDGGEWIEFAEGAP